MTTYGNAFFDAIRDGCRRSAEVVVPRFLDHYRPKSVVDVGCGEGWWGKAFEDAGCEVLGIDGDYAQPVIAHRPHDLSKTALFQTEDDGPGYWDLAVCLEVAEHLPPERAWSFIAHLCVSAPVVLFSAAIPGQGGHGHLNEQWPGYWVDLFEENGFSVSGAFRVEIWTDDRVENWYRQNLLVATRNWELVPSLFENDAERLARLPLVHPVLFEARR